MKVTFFVDGEKQSYDIEASDYLKIQKSVALGEEVVLSEYPYDIKLLEMLIGYKGNHKKAKSDIEYEACDYDMQL